MVLEQSCKFTVVTEDDAFPGGEKNPAQLLLMTNTKISNPRRAFFDLGVLSVLKSLGSKIRGHF